MSNKNNILSPKLDVVFQALFGEIGSENITRSFLECVLGEKIQKVDLSKNPILRRETPNDKLGILDVIAKINNNENCNIEMQLVSKDEEKKRLLFYWSKMYSKGIKSGDDYNCLQRTIVILITNFKIKNFESLGFHTTWKIIETKNRQVILTEDL